MRANGKQQIAWGDLAVQKIDVRDALALSDTEQRMVDRLIASLEQEIATGDHERGASPLLDAARFPSMPEWMALRKSALSLHPLYRGGRGARIAEGIDYTVFTEPLFGCHTAEEVLAAAVGHDRAARIAARHRDFCAAPMSAQAAMLMAGGMDARALRARALAAGSLIVDRCGRSQRALTLASVACGAAGPIAQTAGALRDGGVDVERLTLLDRDPMALAAARAIARMALPEAAVGHHLVDLVDLQRMAAIELAPFAAGGWDVVDILGLFEYLPDPLAIDLVKKAIRATRPGGVIVVANMLDRRPQQRFFAEVVQWPAVIQRSVATFGGLLRAAGVDARHISIVVPSHAPVYAIAAIDVP